MTQMALWVVICQFLTGQVSNMGGDMFWQWVDAGGSQNGVTTSDSTFKKCGIGHRNLTIVICLALRFSYLLS